MSKLTVLPCVLAVALQAVAATLADKLVISPATALHLAPGLPLAAAVVATVVASAAATMSSTTGLPLAINAVDPTIMLAIVKHKP